jgi:hypothetical protein
MFNLMPRRHFYNLAVTLKEELTRVANTDHYTLDNATACVKRKLAAKIQRTREPLLTKRSHPRASL